MDDKIVTTKKGIVKRYQDSSIKVVLEIPGSNEERGKNGIKDIKRILNSELLLQIGN